MNVNKNQAPESQSESYDYRCDYYSLGYTIITLMDPEIYTIQSPSLKFIADCLLQYNPECRPQLSQVFEALKCVNDCEKVV